MKTLLLCTMVLIFCLWSVPAFAAEEDSRPQLAWEKSYVNLGGYIADMNSSFRLGVDNVGLGLIIDTEKFLGMTTNDTAFRLEGGYRFGESMRHKIEAGWFNFSRRSEKTIGEDIALPPEMGGDTLYAETTIASIFNFDIIRAKYKYSIVLDDRVDMNLGVGFYVMPVKIGLGRKGEERKDQDITAPLPVLGLGAEIVVSKHWLLRQNLDLFYLKVGSFKGSILDAQAALEYSNWRHWAVGAGVDGLRLQVEADGKDYPLMDFVGAISFSYFGAQLYVKLLY
jgi:hypothetical protein